MYIIYILAYNFLNSIIEKNNKKPTHDHIIDAVLVAILAVIILITSSCCAWTFYTRYRVKRNSKDKERQSLLSQQ